MNKRQAEKIAKIILACEAISSDAYLDGCNERESIMVSDAMQRHGWAVLAKFGVEQTLQSGKEIRDFVCT